MTDFEVSIGKCICCKTKDVGLVWKICKKCSNTISGLFRRKTTIKALESLSFFSIVSGGKKDV